MSWQRCYWVSSLGEIGVGELEALFTGPYPGSVSPGGTGPFLKNISF